jgi:hypothetical protein
MERVGECEAHAEAYCTTWKTTIAGKEYLGRHCVPTIDDCGHFKAQVFKREDESVRDLSRCDPYR